MPITKLGLFCERNGMASEGKDGGDAEVYATVGRDITGPFFHQGTLAVLSRANGDIIVLEEGKEGGSVLANTGGQPRCVSGVAQRRQERARARACCQARVDGGSDSGGAAPVAHGRACLVEWARRSPRGVYPS